MPDDLLPATHAIDRIALAHGLGHRILGVDGFRIVPEGLESSLDLILDLSLFEMTREAAAAEAEQFIRTHANDKIVFELVIDDQL